MELFRHDGHLSDEGLQAILKGQLDELESLEAAEHLSFCDACVTKYTALLENDVLQAPQTPLRTPVLQKVRRRKVRLFFRKYGTVAAAAVLAVAMWAAGSFFAAGRAPAEPIAPAAQTTTVDADAARTPLSVRVDRFTDNLSQSMNDFFGGLFSSSPGNDSQSAQEKEEENRRREDVFNSGSSARASLCVHAAG